MLTIIATIKLQHLDNIRARLKLCEIRKTCPKEVPFRVLREIGKTIFLTKEEAKKAQIEGDNICQED